MKTQASNIIDRDGFVCDIEPVLFDDELIGPDKSYDVELGLNRLINVQERMAKGMKLINQINARLERANGGDYLPREQFMALVNKRKACWALWFQLKNNAQEIAKEHPALWPEYFKLAEEELTPYWCTSDAEAIDNQEELHHSVNETADCLRDSHIEEMSAYDAKFNENPYLPKDWWDTGYERKLINDQLEFDATVIALENSQF